jgi:trk system potassium uptake protein TrkH
MRKTLALCLTLLFLGLFSIVMAIPLVAAVFWGESVMILAFTIPVLAGLAVALSVLPLVKKMNFIFTRREGIFLVCSIWFFGGVAGALPFYISGYIPVFSSAVFESVSGFTTTGVSVLPDVEILPKSLNLWRVMLHWLGGMGVVMLTVALAPFAGADAFQLLRAETSGTVKEKFTSKVRSTAKILWLIYCGLTFLQAVLLRLSGMSWFDSVAHAFSTMGTGGFSVKNKSISAYNSPQIEWICTVFMIIAGFNFTLIYRAVRGEFKEILKNSEAKAYALILLASSVIIATALLPELGDSGKSVRYALFESASIVTTTGFMIGDHNGWPAAAQAAIFFLMLTGGCSGSTAGGIKIIRCVILFKQAQTELRQTLSPYRVFTVRLDGKAAEKNIVYGAAGFVFMYFLIAFAATFLAASTGLSLWDSFNAAFICLGNTGLGLGRSISGEIFALMPDYGRWGFSALMIIGRLELFTALAVFTRSFWKK